jgi:hypothetical protein
MTEVLQLQDREPLAKGRARLVFEHPDDPSLLIKVIRPEVIEERFGSGTAWYKRRRRFGRFLSYIREIQEFVAVWSAENRSPHFLQKVHGLVETDLGLGLVTSAARAEDGSLAPSLSVLMKDGYFDAEAAAKLENFFCELLDCAVIISDLNPGNLVYAHTPGHGRHFVLIDGLGNNNLWPMKVLSRWFNHRSKLGRIDRLRTKIAKRLAQAGQPNPLASR